MLVVSATVAPELDARAKKGCNAGVSAADRAKVRRVIRLFAIVTDPSVAVAAHPVRDEAAPMTRNIAS